MIKLDNETEALINFIEEQCIGRRGWTPINPAFADKLTELTGNLDLTEKLLMVGFKFSHCFIDLKSGKVQNYFLIGYKSDTDFYTIQSERTNKKTIKEYIIEILNSTQREL